MIHSFLLHHKSGDIFPVYIGGHDPPLHDDDGDVPMLWQLLSFDRWMKGRPFGCGPSTRSPGLLPRDSDQSKRRLEGLARPTISCMTNSRDVSQFYASMER